MRTSLASNDAKDGGEKNKRDHCTACGVDSKGRAKHWLIACFKNVGGLNDEWMVLNSKEKLNDKCIFALYSLLSLKKGLVTTPEAIAEPQYLDGGVPVPTGNL